MNVWKNYSMRYSILSAMICFIKDKKPDHSDNKMIFLTFAPFIF